MINLKNKRILIIAAGVWQIPVIQKAKELGLTVICTDKDPNAPGFQYADFHETIDITDLEGTLKTAEKYRVDAVITEQTDIAVPTAAYVAEKLGLPGIGYEVALRATNKFLMREACRKAGIPMPKYHRVNNLSDAIEVAEEIGYPVIIKPVDSQSSRGVAKIFSPDDIKKWFQGAFSSSRSGFCLIEELMVGTESSIEGFVINEKLNIMGICDKTKCPPPYSYDIRLVYPADFDRLTLDKMIDMNQQITNAIGIKYGITHTEMIVTKDGPRLIEIAARGCGSKVASDLIPAMTGIDITKLRILQAFNIKININKTQQKSGILEFIMLPEGKIVEITGLDEVKNINGVLDIHLFVKVGDVVGVIDCGRKRPGYLLAIGDSRGEVIEIAEEVKKKLHIRIETLTYTSKVRYYEY